MHKYFLPFCGMCLHFFLFLRWTDSCSASQAIVQWHDLGLWQTVPLVSNDSAASAFQVAEITVSHYLAQLIFYTYLFTFETESCSVTQDGVQ